MTFITSTLDNRDFHPKMKAKIFVEICEEIFGWTWLYSRQLAVLVEVFRELGQHKRSRFYGTFRVDLVASLYDRVVDVDNFELVIKALSSYEVACVLCRLGYLNVYNPLKPDGAWEFELSRYEERVVAKTLCALAVQEPGDNWPEKSFRWTRESDAMPGFELTQTWMVDEGLPSRGILQVTYASTPQLGIDLDFRKSLLQLVRAKESDIGIEDHRNFEDPTKLRGYIRLRSNMSIWTSFLSPSAAFKKNLT